MRALLLLAMVLGTSACGFSGSNGSVVDGPPGDGSGGQDRPDSCVPGFVNLCGEAAGTMDLVVNGAVKIDTDRDSRCRVKTQAGGPSICLIALKRLEITGGSVLTFFGTRAAAVMASEEIVIAGSLDVAARRNAPMMEPAAGSLTTCTFGRTPEEDQGGGGGGAGGTYATQGGVGGEGDLDDNGPGADDDTGLGGLPGATVTLSLLRGGCPGQLGGYNSGPRGRGGRSGGAVYLTAPLIQVTGAVSAAGAAGSGGSADIQGGGGGGGGSGGAIVLEGAMVRIETGATLLATGGGAGQGGDNDSLGEDGTDATSALAAAAGGNAANNGGDGGNGSTTAAGAPGTSSNAGAGGGGGGSGYIRLIGASVTIVDALIVPGAVTN
jgi:hypothetical protein